MSAHITQVMHGHRVTRILVMGIFLLPVITANAEGPGEL
jgi:hypothetical protein